MMWNVQDEEATETVEASETTAESLYTEEELAGVRAICIYWLTDHRVYYTQASRSPTNCLCPTHETAAFLPWKLI